MSTQHIDEADELADNVCVMALGKIIVHDTPDQIKHKYGMGYTLVVERPETIEKKPETKTDQS